MAKKEMALLANSRSSKKNAANPCFQIVLEQCNKPDKLMNEAKEKFGLESSIVLHRRAGRELLTVAKFFRT